MQAQGTAIRGTHAHERRYPTTTAGVLPQVHYQLHQQHGRRPHAGRRRHVHHQPVVTTHALNIDRRQHLDLAWKRQQEKADRLQQQLVGDGHVAEVHDLAELDSVVSQAGNSLVVVFFYTAACGVCKEAAQRFMELAVEASRQRARVVFAKHDIITEFDERSEISQWHKVKAVPCFMFFDEGAVVRRLSLRDIRRLTGPTALIQAAVREDLAKLRDTLQQVVLSRAPSARP